MDPAWFSFFSLPTVLFVIIHPSWLLVVLFVFFAQMVNTSDSFVHSVETGRIEKEKNVTSRASKRTSCGKRPLTPAELQYRQALHNLRLREAFTAITAEKTRILEENRRLRELLILHGIPFDTKDFQNTNAAIQLQQQPPPPEVQRLSRTYDELGVEFVLAWVFTFPSILVLPPALLVVTKADGMAKQRPQ